jgi:hypothetical protein
MGSVVQKCFFREWHKNVCQQNVYHKMNNVRRESSNQAFGTTIVLAVQFQ